MFKTNEVSLVDRLRSFQRSDKSNKRCANCGELGPVYICMEFLTFICTDCAGIHRELSHKVKSISMSNWTKEEIDRIESMGGNATDKLKFLSCYEPNSFQQPLSANRDRLREFIRAKYIDCRWFTHDNATKQARNTSGPKIIDTLFPSPSKLGNSGKEKKKVERNHRVTHELGKLRSFSPTLENESTRKVLSPNEKDIEDEIQDHFGRGIAGLKRLGEKNSAEARNLAIRIIDSIEQQINRTGQTETTKVPRNNEPDIEASRLHTPPPPDSTSSTNPFDFLPYALHDDPARKNASLNDVWAGIFPSEPTFSPPTGQMESKGQLYSNPFDF